MAISKERKKALVAQYQTLMEQAKGMIITSYSGLTMKELGHLRGQIREVGGEFHIVKNTLLDLAAKNIGLTLPEGSFDGTTAIGFAEDEVATVAKAIVDMSRETDMIRLKGGLIEGEIYDADSMVRFADLPPLPVVRAQLLGLLETPATRIAGAFSGSLRQVASLFKAYSESEAAGSA